MKNLILFQLLFWVSGIFVLGCFTTPLFAQDVVKIENLLHVIDSQQRQNEDQQRQIEDQQKQLNSQRQLLLDLQKQLESLVKVKDAEKKEVPVVAGKPFAKPPVASTKVPPPVENVITSGGGERAKLSLSGFVNRMVTIADDGKDTDAYYVDNDNAESRINLVGTVSTTKDLTIGSRIELTIAPNKSGVVNQENQADNNDVFDQRWAEVSLDSKRFGKLSLGKGDTASMNTAASDLSRTTVIAYATITDTAGGLLFRQKDNGTLTDVSIFDAFQNFDGLNRRNRVRYDLPAFYGFRLGTTAIADERYDGALRWGGQGYGFKAVASAGIAYVNEVDADFQYDGSLSILHDDTGLNLTLSGGWLERDYQSDPTNFYAKAGWLHRFFPWGVTAFAVDYTQSMYLPTDGDEGYSIGAAVVQPFDEYGTEIYALYRYHTLDRDDEPEVEDINIVTVGARVKF
jgi:hypothetical protein